MIKVPKYEKIYINYAFIQSLVIKCIVPFSKLILHYKNILVSTSFEHVQYNKVLIIVAKSKGLTSEVKLLFNCYYQKVSIIVHFN